MCAMTIGSFWHGGTLGCFWCSYTWVVSGIETLWAVLGVETLWAISGVETLSGEGAEGWGFLGGRGGGGSSLHIQSL